jgi:hypothetical protein
MIRSPFAPRLVTAIASLVVAGCSSDAFHQCTVVCPANTLCENDRCLPRCEPACASDEHCGADFKCHKGAAPEAGILPLDAGGDSKRDRAPDADPNKALCDCLAKQPKQLTCAKQKTTCTQPSDCCLATSPLPCLTYGNTYSCKSNVCEKAGCSGKSDCVAYATTLKLPDPSGWSCRPPVCSGQLSTCAQDAKGCTKDSDCCDAGSKVPCGTYSNKWRCAAGGTCEAVSCAVDAECVQYAQALGATNAASYTCRSHSCGGVRFCAAPGKGCSQPSDCCISGSPIPCGTYANRYRCESSECVLDPCSGAADCQAYATALKLPDVADYSCVNP